MPVAWVRRRWNTRGLAWAKGDTFVSVNWLTRCYTIAILSDLWSGKGFFLGGCAPKPPLALPRVHNQFRTAICPVCFLIARSVTPAAAADVARPARREC